MLKQMGREMNIIVHSDADGAISCNPSKLNNGNFKSIPGNIETREQYRAWLKNRKSSSTKS